MQIAHIGRRLALCFVVSLILLSVPLETALAVSLNSLSGAQVSLDKYKGKHPVLLFFWTTWCPYCRQEIKHLNQMNAELKKESVNAFAVNIGESSYKVNRFFKDYALKISVLLDTDSSFSEKQDISGVPTYIMFNKKGAEVYRGNVFPKDYKSLVK